MTLLQWAFFLLVTTAQTSKIFAFRYVDGSLNARQTAFLIGPANLLGVLLTLPYAYSAGLLNAPWLAPTAVATGLIKGVGIWFLAYMIQAIVGKSMSTVVYTLPIGVGLVAVTNYFLLGESLSMPQWVSVFILTALGVTFFFYGHLRHLNRADKRYFPLMVMLVVLFGILDHVAIDAANWFVYLFWSGIGCLGASLYRLPKNYLRQLPVRPSIFILVMWAITEVTVYITLVTILPVSMVALATAMRLPIIMLISGWKLGEDKLTTQAAFSFSAILAILPLLFG